MLKFGQIIDLEKLERMGVNKNAEELKEKLNKNENKYANELNEWHVSISLLIKSIYKTLKKIFR